MKEAVKVRYSGWFKTVLLASLLVGGCESGRAVARKKLADQVDQARRLYNQATSYLANPRYVDTVTGLSIARDETVVLKDGTKLTGQVTSTRTGYRIATRTGQVREVPVTKVARFESFETPASEIAVSTQPADLGAAAAKILDEAGRLVKDALSGNLDAPPGAKAQAHKLLGEIEFARGSLLAAGAERLRSRSSELRGHARTLVSTSRNYAILADFNKSMANMPRDKLLQTRNDTQKQLAAANDRIKAVDGKIAALQEEMKTLGGKNAALTKKARGFRDGSERQGGKRGLDLLKQAHDAERAKNRNLARIDQAKDEIAVLLVDKAFEQSKAAAAKAKLALMNKRFETMDQQKQAAEKAMQAAKADAGRTFEEAQAVSSRVVSICKQASVKEAGALTALDKAIRHLGNAKTHARAEREAARAAQSAEPQAGSEISQGLADDKHLAAIMAAEASAGLATAELRARQLAIARGNAELADAIEALAKQMSVGIPGVVAELKAYLPKAAQTRDQAAGEYQQAAKLLESVLRTHLKDSIGRNIRWIYQAQLADTYLGHYRLTSDVETLKKAKVLIDEAVGGKEGSPFLTSSRRLKALIDAAGG